MARNACKKSSSSRTSHLKLVQKESSDFEDTKPQLSEFAKMMDEFADQLELEIEMIKNW